MWFFLAVASAFLYASTNVINSTLVARYVQSPSLLMWVMTLFTMVALFILALTYDVRSSWALILIACGIISYAGDWFFFWVLDRLDVSTVNAAWAIQAIFISIIGFFFFGETWNVYQCIGAGFVIAGVFFLSFFHAHVSLRYTVLLLAVLAAFYIPLMLARKSSLAAGETLPAVFFWLMLGRDAAAFVFPVFFATQRRLILQTLKRFRVDFFLLCGFVALAFLAGEFLVLMAYARGPVSLIAITSNAQPFFVILLAALLAKFSPELAPKELFTRKSILVKITAFAIVFAGLALLALSQ